MYIHCVHNTDARLRSPEGTATLEDRGLDFIDAVALFDGRPMLTAPSNWNDEERYKSIAQGEDGKLYSVIWTWRDGDLWIISFRRAHNDEARNYRDHVR